MENVYRCIKAEVDEFIKSVMKNHLSEVRLDVIRDVRKKYNMKKVGHTGTLDPLATGVLPILLGDATKLSKYLIDLAKNYSAFYNKNKILVNDKCVANARMYLTYMVNIVLKNGAKILGIEMPDRM